MQAWKGKGRACLQTLPACPCFSSATYSAHPCAMQINAAGDATVAWGSSFYSNGLWWGIKLDVSVEEKCPPDSDVGLYLRFELPPGVVRAPCGLVGAAAVGPTALMAVSVAGAQPGGAQPSWDAGTGKSAHFCARPLYLETGSGCCWGWPGFPFTKHMPDGSPIRRSNFRSAGSPILHDGGKLLVKCRVEFV